jgi:uncharacterized membrane protein
MEWIIIILLVIFIIMVTMKPVHKTFNQTQKVQCYNESNKIKITRSDGLVMLPKPNPPQLTTHITV